MLKYIKIIIEVIKCMELLLSPHFLRGVSSNFPEPQVTVREIFVHPLKPGRPPLFLPAPVCERGSDIGSTVLIFETANKTHVT